ncbi:MAG TPA: 16S rRNA methyltransferase [Thiotrichales bacterium]|nr:16S rRNA methyltransferase [Thiotrichales bacterium]
MLAGASDLAERFGLHCVSRPPSSGMYLELDEGGLGLRRAGAEAMHPVRVDFTAGALAHRRRFGGGRRQPLARAVGMAPGFDPDVFDATAGLGRDAFVLASLGCRVRLCERSPVVAALLADGLARAVADSEIGAWVEARMQLLFGDAVEWLQQLGEEERPDVVYLDPMYPSGKGKAQVKKEMQLLRGLLGPDRDSAALFEAARMAARRRVVVKRPVHAGWLHDARPAASIASRKTRYDIYAAGDRG